MEKLSISAIKAILNEISSADDPRLAEFRSDARKGVQQALAQWQRQQDKQRALVEKYHAMSVFEEEKKAQGFQAICGIDEVGRGPLAGPVVAAAVILNEEHEILGLNDSKQLSAQKREELVTEIKRNARAIGIGEATAEEIDQLNIYQATKVAMQRAIDQLEIAPDCLLIDAMVLENGLPQEKIIKGDARSVSIAAASIVAKVYRDEWMADYGTQYPAYGFAKNAGYGTKEHLAALENYGILPIHRKTFAPIKNK
ncbi:ribonuclease HII [Enterococcus pseudoavium]|uniref:Ribonuclease HII n=1 Tax=Enterococcus pseudoavium TaxID=44007 RepID=A0ABU3FIY1_9ENTE|nr:ribonuclease HII [Enterococcus pseudoavium]MDT2753799.1 ribonuclease HII [Enterococcus pseudoavium]MDT2771020.1 ribonuclease HII [Enterococcus pseudoavium]REC31495.1 ribonuclease HII [Enterococcus pseudoavium]